MSESYREIDLTPGAETQRLIAEAEEEAAFYKKTYTPPAPVPPEPAPAALIDVLKLIIKLAIEAQSQPAGAKKKDKPDVIGGWVAGGPPGLERR